MLAKKRVRKNYYRNSRVRRKERILRRFVLSLKMLGAIAGIGGASLLLILVHDALTQSSYFEARTITVQGNGKLSKESILEQAKVKLHDNILGVNLKIVRCRLLANSLISTAEVERELPDAIHIRIRERVPIAKVVLDQPFYISESGDLFKLSELSGRTSVPIVTGLRLSDIDLKNPRRSPLLSSVMEVLHLSRLHGSVLPLHALHSIDVDREMGLTLYAFDHDMAIKFGFGGYESKFNRLRDIISYLGHGEALSSIECVGLNDSKRVVVRPLRRVSLLGVCYRKEM